VGFEELVRFTDDLYGIAFNIDEEEIGVVLLGDYSQLHTGDEVTRTGRVMDVAVGDSLLGRVIDPLGRALDGKGPIGSLPRLPIERDAKAIMGSLTGPACHCRPASRSSMHLRLSTRDSDS